MDIVTKNLVSSFKEEESLSDDTEDSTLFEHFANFCVVSNEYGEEFDVDDIHTGGGDDLQLDGLAIIVNGTLVADITEVEDLAATTSISKRSLCSAKRNPEATSPVAKFQFFSLELKISFPKTRLFLETTLSKRRKLSLGSFTSEVRFSSEAIPSCTCTT